MPGVDLAILRGLSVETLAIKVNGSWWNDAAGAAVPLPDQQPWQSTLDTSRGRAEPA
ncbi:hypothetical protein [Actinoplanes siamensis]|uniref:Uncharacterized protein n=1 Tax=Actinoplanes siamensis TaxID=1223317 RepID=A0A919NCV7_9ACTN|nr:hypothetical protein [Actinoplanes siamensis]GIF08892.1 hypothetical protein Asi03nite_64300 [Actinoplanes siamensis]